MRANKSGSKAMQSKQNRTSQGTPQYEHIATAADLDSLAGEFWRSKALNEDLTRIFCHN